MRSTPRAAFISRPTGGLPTRCLQHAQPSKRRLCNFIRPSRDTSGRVQVRGLEDANAHRSDEDAATPSIGCWVLFASLDRYPTDFAASLCSKCHESGDRIAVHAPVPILPVEVLRPGGALHIACGRRDGGGGSRNLRLGSEVRGAQLHSGPSLTQAAEPLHPRLICDAGDEHRTARCSRPDCFNTANG